MGLITRTELLRIAAGSRIMPYQLMTIGQLAHKCHVTPRAIRYYEKIGILKAAARSESNYRIFDSEALECIRFISKCRALGFSIEEITELLRITANPDHTCGQVKEITHRHLAMIDNKLQALMKMRQPVAKCLSRCTGQDVPECAVLEYLSNSN
jgi:Cu(I)-responsive transcriptional regulator